MQIEIINNKNTCILKTWYQHFARHTGVHRHHCVSPSVSLIGFPRIPSDTQVIFEGVDWGSGIHYSLKNLVHYSSHKTFGLFVKIRPTIFIKSKKGGKEIWSTIHCFFFLKFILKNRIIH